MGEVEEKKPMTMRVQEWRGLGKYPYNRLTLSKSLENCQWIGSQRSATGRVDKKVQDPVS